MQQTPLNLVIFSLVFDISLIEITTCRWLGTAISQWCVFATVASLGRSLQSRLLTR